MDKENIKKSKNKVYKSPTQIEIEKQNLNWVNKKPPKPAWKTYKISWAYKTRFTKNIEEF